VAPQVHQSPYHQFNNGRAQPIFYMSDTETERSLGEVTIPMTTFKAPRKRIPSDNQILDASQLDQGDCRKEPRRDPLCTKTKINQKC
jgi:hypothetical protein